MLAALAPYASQIIVALVFVLLFIAQYLSGKRQLTSQDQSVSSEVISAYAEQVKQLKEKQKDDKERYDKDVSDFRNEIRELTLRIGKQDGIIQEKEKLIEEYKEIFQNRNPELVEVLGDIREFMKNIYSKIELIDKRSEHRESRDKAVDEGHVAALSKLQA
jgi:uncharacterized membrane protein YhiD involved in acid resistance